MKPNPKSAKSYFYPRPPRGGRRFRGSVRLSKTQFLSTPSARRATPEAPAASNRLEDFYPRPPRGGRRPHLDFLAVAGVISIHALREEGDAPPSKNGQTGGYFYPRPPRGGRRVKVSFPLVSPQFLSTPSARRATPCRRAHCQTSQISIHALREEGDASGRKLVHPRSYFYPRPPRGGRRFPPVLLRGIYRDFYPRPPRGGRRVLVDVLVHRLVFLSTPSARRATPRR